LALSLIRSGLLSFFLMGNLFQGVFVPGENFFLDLSTLLNVLGLVSSTLVLLYFRDIVFMRCRQFRHLRMCFLDNTRRTRDCGVLKLQSVQRDLDTLRRNRSGVQILA